MALKYWHTVEATSDRHNLQTDFFFRTEDGDLSDVDLMALWFAGTLFEADDGALLNPRSFDHLEPATVTEYDAWIAGRTF